MTLDQRSLAEGLGVRIGVRPAEGLGTGGPRLDELGPDPVLTHLLGPDGDQV